MNSPEAKPREAIETRLRIAKGYWAETVQPYIVGRKLREPELYVATDAYLNLSQACDDVSSWNTRREGGDPIPIPELGKDGFFKPEPLYAEGEKSETLAAIAASMLKTESSDHLTAIRTAHDLLIAAERYVASLPKRPESEVLKSFTIGFGSSVSFREIMESNKIGTLPLLPPQQRGRNKGAANIPRMSLRAITVAVRNYLAKQSSRMTKKEYEDEQQKNDALAKKGVITRVGDAGLTYEQWQEGANAWRSGQILVSDLCCLRLE